MRAPRAASVPQWSWHQTARSALLDSYARSAAAAPRQQLGSGAAQLASMYTTGETGVRGAKSGQSRIVASSWRRPLICRTRPASAWSALK